PNKVTANKFYEKLVYLLGGDFTGIAVFSGEILVQDVSQMMRYFYHLDNPNKERFDYDNSYLNCDICFSPYVAKAFDLEITNILTIMLLGSGIHTLDFLFKKSSINSFVLQYWLRQGRNLYYISKLLDENLKNNIDN
ncbi:MAG: replication protein, partial [archaeon]|nr:replication protein [archaeon]